MTSPMHVAVAKGNPELCALLLERGDSVNVRF
jgi:ankyrin repeat protein